MKTITKGLVGAVAAGAMAMGTAAPAQARDRGGIDAGEIIAGALIIGGIAAVVAAASKDDDRDRYGYRDYDRRGYDARYYNGAGDPRSAVDMCVRAAERTASRYSYGGRADVTDIRDIDRKRDGYKIKGRIAVNSNDRHYRNTRYGRGWNNDYRGWNSNLRGYDSGNFTCEVKYGRIHDLDFSGIRGL